MIPREILKKIRQIELRANRIVFGSADGARASARFTVIQPAPSEPISQLTSIRKLKRRERRAPMRSVPASRNPNSIEIAGFGNCGEFAAIKRRVNKVRLVLIPSNSTGLENSGLFCSKEVFP